MKYQSPQQKTTKDVPSWVRSPYCHSNLCEGKDKMSSEIAVILTTWEAQIWRIQV
jgi:hypothetical protein